MDFRLSESQAELASGIRSLLEGQLPLEHLRRQEGAEVAISPEDWQRLAEVGVFSLILPEPDGVGLGVADATVVFEELGRALVPGPLVGTFLAASAGLVDGAAEGQAQVGVQTLNPTATGTLLVEHLSSLDALLVLADTTGIPSARLIRPAPAGSAADRVTAPLCPLTPMWRQDTLPDGSALTHPGLAARLCRQGTVLTAALQVGHAAATLEAATAYAKERQQFGQPIGGFQAIKHICADMLVRAEVARAAVHAAACLIDQPDVAAEEAARAGSESGDVVDRATMGAKLLADEAAVANARAAIQVHGGMGFTWEVPVHLHLKRARLLATTFGTAAELSLGVHARTGMHAANGGTP